MLLEPFNFVSQRPVWLPAPERDAEQQGRTHVRTVGFQGTLQGANSGAVIVRCRQRAQAWGHRPVREGQLREREDSDNEEARRAGPLSPQRSSQSVQGGAFLHVSLN